MREHFDVVVIGAGPGGYVAAIRAAQLGLMTAIVDKKWLGGVCINVGCIPSKALLRNAEIARLLREKSRDFGFSFDNLQLDYSLAQKRSRQVSERLAKGVGFLMKKNNVAVFFGTARVDKPVETGEIPLSITDNAGETTVLAAGDVILATGASAIMPAAWKGTTGKVVSYLEAILQDHLPASAVIIGAGAIGMEFATIWNSYGVDVTIVEMLPHVLPLEENEAANEVTKNYSRRGVKILAGHKVESVEETPTGVRISVSEAGSAPKELIAEQALVAIGFRPNVSDLGLEQAGVTLTERGFIQIDERMATNIPHIWAIGDVTGKLMLAHVASAMGVACAENIAKQPASILDYEMMPRATYCSPQVASFGLSEEKARERGMNIKVGRFPFQANGKALGLADYAGWVKLIVDATTEKILGAVMVGPEVTELLPELTLASLAGLAPSLIGRNVHAHPTLSETLMEASLDVNGEAINL